MSLVFALAAAACGGKQSAPATTSTTPQDDKGHAEHEGPTPGMTHEGMPAEMTKFHDVLAPRWHAEKGPQRMKDTCAALPQLKTDADAIAKATPPTKANADTWTTGTRALVDSVNALETTCKANDTAKFEQAFHSVHESFHGLMAQAGVEHKPGEHEHKAGGHEHKM